MNIKNLSNTDLRGIDFSNTDLRDIDLFGVNLINANLSGANLINSNLMNAYLYGANLSNAVLINACLCRADLRETSLRGANLSNANLSGADLRETSLRGANLSNANLSGADLCGANLSETDLRGVNLIDANLIGAKNVPFIPLACPDYGSFIGFKAAHGFVVCLEILEDAKRSSATSRKCRCDKAKVVSIQNLDGSIADVNEVPSDQDANFIYKVGEIVTVPDFDEDRWKECSTGIHFFINRQDAVGWAMYSLKAIID